MTFYKKKCCSQKLGAVFFLLHEDLPGNFFNKLSRVFISIDKKALWLSEKLRDGKSEYVQGVEVPVDYSGVIPEGFDVISLPECDYLMFQGEPFGEEDFEEAIGSMWESKKNMILQF